MMMKLQLYVVTLSHSLTNYCQDILCNSSGMQLLDTMYFISVVAENSTQ